MEYGLSAGSYSAYAGVSPVRAVSSFALSAVAVTASSGASSAAVPLSASASAAVCVSSTLCVHTWPLPFGP